MAEEKKQEDMRKPEIPPILDTPIEKITLLQLLKSELKERSVLEMQGMGTPERYIQNDALRSIATKLAKDMEKDVTVEPIEWIQMGIMPDLPEEQLLPLIFPESAEGLEHFEKQYFHLAQYFFHKRERDQASSADSK